MRNFLWTPQQVRGDNLDTIVQHCHPALVVGSSTLKFLIILFFFFLPSKIFAQKIRSTSFDDRQACEDAKGVWRQFGNGCADQCRDKFDEFSICTQAVTNACDCGKNKCWDGETCVALKEYKKIYDKEQIEEQKILDAAKEKRKAEAEENAQAILVKINTDLASDPNNPKKNDQQPNQQQNQQQTTNVQMQTQPSVPAIQAIPIAPAVPIQQQTTASNSQVPPLFLQQEQSKQNANSDSQKNKTTGGLLDSSVPVGLPVIPLPN